jgi:hypothetical protein
VISCITTAAGTVPADAIHWKARHSGGKYRNIEFTGFIGDFEKKKSHLVTI